MTDGFTRRATRRPRRPRRTPRRATPGDAPHAGAERLARGEGAADARRGAQPPRLPRGRGQQQPLQPRLAPAQRGVVRGLRQLLRDEGRAAPEHRQRAGRGEHPRPRAASGRAATTRSRATRSPSAGTAATAGRTTWAWWRRCSPGERPPLHPDHRGQLGRTACAARRTGRTRRSSTGLAVSAERLAPGSRLPAPGTAQGSKVSCAFSSTHCVPAAPCEIAPFSSFTGSGMSFLSTRVPCAVTSFGASASAQPSLPAT